MVFTAAALGDLAGPGSTQTLLNGALRSNPRLTHGTATLWLRPRADYEVRGVVETWFKPGHQVTNSGKEKGYVFFLFSELVTW